MSKLLRIKCENCKEVVNVSSPCKCKKCGNDMVIPEQACVQLYRKGAMCGAAVGYGIYINNIPYGHLGNGESIRIPLNYGTYTFTFTCGMTRDCEPITVELTPQNRYVCMKAQIKTGFWKNKIIAEICPPERMPSL